MKISATPFIKVAANLDNTDVRNLKQICKKLDLTKTDAIRVALVNMALSLKDK